MRKYAAGCFALLIVASIGSCFLISATGNYDFTNETSNHVRVEWKTLHDGAISTTGWIAPGRTVRLTTQRLLEADSIPPSQCFETFRVEADLSDDWLTIYEYSESPDDFDAEWETKESGYRSHTYTFVFTTVPAG